MRRLSQLMRTPVFTPLVIVIAFFIRASASLGRPIARFPDSLGYETFHLFGSVDRFWPIPFLYSIVTTDTGRVLLHVVIGSSAWAWCALVLSGRSNYPRVILATVLLLGLSPQIVRYDLAILSESLGLSFMVLAVTATINLLRRRSPLSLGMWLVAISLCANTRPVQLFVLIVALAIPLLKFVASRGRKISTSTAVLLFVLLAGFLQLRGNANTSTLNFYTVLQERIMLDDARFDWFSNHGMPVVTGMRNASGYDFSGDLPPDVSNIITLPAGQQPPTLMRVGGAELAAWVVDKGWTTYARYLVTHPHDSFSRLTSLTNEALSPPNDDFLPLDNGPMIPRVLFGSWELWSVLGLGSLVLVFLKNRQECAVLLGLSVAGCGVFGLSMLTSGIEHPRHAVTSAAALRLIALVAIVFALPKANQKAELDESVAEQ